ncbi:prolyl 4-hydroxylase subunit alpha-1-like [Syngnathoides biaculeatus]|uniref:prolyl 4-hydroxylase subunit alpha-1-like n=1 Tax=Syngnathoides biaculeatus TaxID=300417 RepID=UPI002ADE042A|nr:prolyl 4-hydroxylase subunit alpha-1-like [Syngnathoides biaculeatus]
MAIFFSLLLLIGSSSADHEFYSSISHMTDLLYTEHDLVASLEDYIQAEETKLEQIKRWAQKLANLSAFALEDPEGFLGHPVNAFKLLKRINKEWSELESLVLTDVSDGFVSELGVKRQRFPDNGDLTGAAQALLRLQDTYELDTDTLAKGELPGNSRLCSGLTVDDCYDLGMVAYKGNDFYHTELWTSQALRQLEEGETPATADAVTLLDYHSYSLYKQGDLERAKESTKRLLEIDPGNERAVQNLKYFEFHLEKQKTGEETPETLASGRAGRNGAYERLCRGDSVELTPRRWSRLFCRYQDNRGHPNLLIDPAKEEDVWDLPRIVRYHDVASDRDMETVKELARPKLLRSMVKDGVTEKSYTVSYRISKNAWLGDKKFAAVDRMVRRMGDITGLDTSTAEEMQVVNYGVGGQYEPHMDFQGDDVPEPYAEFGTGNRIATWLLYMSDVQAGGATVFPRAGAVVWPVKGSAVFWYNLLLNGKGDRKTEHAACPVLVGSKWVSNKWLHERGQEFRRRCSLESSD